MKRVIISIIGVLVLLSMFLVTAPVAAATTTLDPSGSGSGYGSTNLSRTGGTANWDACSTSDGDTSYVYTTNYSYRTDWYALPDPGLSGTINSVTVWMEAKRESDSYTAQDSAQTVIRVGSNNYYGTAETLTTDYANYSTTYNTNPAGGSWDWSDINNLQAGVSLRRAGSSGYWPFITSYFSRCTHVWVVVDYTPPGPSYTLTLNTSGSGTAAKIPSQPTYTSGTVVAVEATPNSGQYFTGWSGDLSSTANPTNIVMDGNKTVTANFAPNIPSCGTEYSQEPDFIDQDDVAPNDDYSWTDLDGVPVNQSGIWSPQDDWSYVDFTAAGNSYVIYAADYDFDIDPDTSTITGIRVEYERHADGSVTDSMVALVKNGTDPVGTPKSGDSWAPAGQGDYVDEVAYFGGPCDLWGTTWTVAEIEASGFGVAVAAQGESGATAYIDDIDITVFYDCECPCATINIQKVIDNDCDLQTSGDQTSSPDPTLAGWVYNYTVTNGTPASGNVTTDNTGAATFNVCPTSPAAPATITITETVKSYYDLMFAVCSGASYNGGFEDANHRIAGIQVDSDDNVTATFYNQPDADEDGVGDYCDNCVNTPNPGQEDDDQDGAGNACDNCPDDPNKTEPGICGCGTSDTDSDGDGTPDCNDNCPNDPNKTEPGICGCGTPDTDSDGDGTPDCNDLCPADPNKTAPGICGCGTPDTDSDGDGTPDCNDLCPADPYKTAPGICGCGVSDVDTDGDGTPDCNDLCPADPNKTAPGICGCGVPDVDNDGDGVVDCQDLCPNDPNKTAPGICGCGVPDDDTDGDGVADCNDLCPNDPNKTDPGVCGCGTPDTDTDGDGTPDCIDNCPNDPNKTDPGICGCGTPDDDTDGDGVYVCDDCDDNDPNNYPGNTENCTDGQDNDCDQLVDCDDPDCPCDTDNCEACIDGKCQSTCTGCQTCDGEGSCVDDDTKCDTDNCEECVDGNCTSYCDDCQTCDGQGGCVDSCSADAGPDQLIGLGGSVTIGGTPPSSCEPPDCTYGWTPTDGLDDPTSPNPSASPTSTTTYTLTVYYSEGCEVTDSVIVEVITPPAGGAGGPAPDRCFMIVDMLGERISVEMDCCENCTVEEVEAYDESLVHLFELADETLVQCGDCEGCNCYPKIIVMSLSEETIEPPDGMTMVGPLYDFTGYKDIRQELACDLATYFDPTATVLLNYDPELLPVGASEPVIGFFSHVDNQWVLLPPDAGRVAEIGTATGVTGYFASPFAVLASAPPVEETPEPPPANPSPAHFVASGLSITPVEVNTGEAVTISLNVANDGEEGGTYTVELVINGSGIDSKIVTLGGGEDQAVSFAVSASEAGTYDASAAGLNGSFTVVKSSMWWIYIIIAAAVILLGLMALRFRRKPAKK